MRRKENGITLIALAITIIVILILAGVSLSMIKDKKGPITEAYQTTESAQRESIIEKIEADLYNEKVRTGKTPNKAKLIQIIQNGKYNTGEVEKDSFVSKDGNYIIEYTEILGWEDKSSIVISLVNINEAGSVIEVGNTKFYVAIFNDEALTKRVGNVQTIQFENGKTEASTTFDGLQNGTYYVAETNEKGDVINDNQEVDCDKGIYSPFYINGQKVQINESETTEKYFFKNTFSFVY